MPPKAKKIEEEFTLEPEPTLEERALSVPEQARELKVIDSDSWIRASNFLGVIKDLRKEIDDTLDPVVKKAHEAHKAAVAAKKKVEAPLVEAETYLRGDMSRYKREVDAANAAARRQAEIERQREVESLEQRGDLSAADAVRMAPVVVDAEEPPVGSGVDTRSIWRAEVTDKMALIRAVAEGRVPEAVLAIDTKVLGSLARSLKGALNYPGVRVVEDVGIAVRRRGTE